MRGPRKRKDSGMTAGFWLRTVSGNEGTFHRGKDLGGERLGWGRDSKFSCVSVILRWLRDIQRNIPSVSAAHWVWSTGLSSGLDEGVICLWVVFYARRVSRRTQGGDDTPEGVTV